MLKDGLKEVIKVKLEAGSFKFSSIDEVIISWYEDYKFGMDEKKDITYREQKLKIVYDVVLNDEGEVIEETDFITIRKYLEEQINEINDMLDGK